MKFSLTLWYLRDKQAEASYPDVAELSFKLDFDKVAVGSKVEERANELFKALRTGMGDWVDPGSDTKTAAALEGVCRPGSESEPT